MTQATQQRFDYQIRACVLIDKAVVAHLMECSKRHYDGHCKSVGQPGGFLYGWHNLVNHMAPDEATPDVTASFRELDTLAKLTEIHSNTPNMAVYMAIKKILDAINAEIVNLREHGRPTWDDAPFTLAGLFTEPQP